MGPTTVKVFGLFLVWCSKGLYLEIAGPTMIDIKRLFNATYEDVSRSVSGRGAGGFLGAVIGGIVTDKLPDSIDLFIGVSESVAALAVMSVPFSMSINTIWFHYFLLGACSGIINIAGIRSVITITAGKSATSLQVMHTGYSIGAFLLPVCVNPFLGVFENQRIDMGNNVTSDFKVVKESQVYLAFLAVGIFTLCLSFLFYYFQFTNQSGTVYHKLSATGSLHHQAKKKPTCADMVNPATYANGQFGYGLFVIIGLSFYYFSMVGGQETFAHFIRSFSVDAYRFTKTQASYLNTTFWLSLTAGRFFWALVSNRISIRRLFLLQVASHAILTTCFCLFVGHSSSLLWLFTSLEGFLISPLYPCGIAFGNTLIELSGVCLMLIGFAGSFGDLTYLWLTGSLYDMYGPMAVLYMIQVVGLVLFICVITLRCGEKYKKHGIPKISNA